MLVLKNKQQENKRANENDLRLLREQNERIENEIDDLRKVIQRMNNFEDLFQNKNLCCFCRSSTQYFHNNNEHKPDQSKTLVEKSKCDVDNHCNPSNNDVNKYCVTNNDVINAQTGAVCEEQAIMRRRRFGQLRRTFSSSSIPSEHDDENTEYTPLVNKTTKTNGDKNNEYVFQYLDSLPPATKSKNCAVSANICAVDGENHEQTEISSVSISTPEEKHQERKSKTLTDDDDRRTETASQPLVSMVTDNQDGGHSCARLQIPQITITDTMATFYHFENATDHQSSVYMNEE